MQNGDIRTRMMMKWRSAYILEFPTAALPQPFPQTPAKCVSFWASSSAAEKMHGELPQVVALSPVKELTESTVSPRTQGVQAPKSAMASAEGCLSRPPATRRCPKMGTPQMSVCIYIYYI